MKDNHDKTALALIAVITADVIWGFSFMATTMALKHTSVFMLLSIRFTASLLIMLLLILIGIGRLDLKNKPLAPFLLMGLCEPVIYFIAETYGVKNTTSSFSGMTLSLIPITTSILSAVFLKERLSPVKLMWIICSVAGVALISVNQTSEGIIQAKGVFCLLISMIAASFFSILSRRTAESFTSFERTFIMMLMGCVAFTGMALAQEQSSFVPVMFSALQNKDVMLPVLFLSAICSVTAFFFINYGMTYLDVSRVVVFSNITPVVSVLAGIMLLGEPFSFIYLVGMVLILTGLVMVNRVD